MFKDNTTLLRSIHGLFVFLYVTITVVMGVVTQYSKREECALGTAFVMGIFYHLICTLMASKLMTYSLEINGYSAYRWGPSIVIEIATITAILSLYGFNILSDMGPQFAIAFYIVIMMVAFELDRDIHAFSLLFVPIFYCIFILLIAIHTHAKPDNKLTLPIYISVFFPLLKLIFQQIHFRFMKSKTMAKVNPDDVEEGDNSESMQEVTERLEKHIKETRRNIYMDSLFHLTTFLFTGTVSIGFILVTI